jgi:hypothetical protein
MDNTIAFRMGLELTALKWTGKGTMCIIGKLIGVFGSLV